MTWIICLGIYPSDVRVYEQQALVVELANKLNEVEIAERADADIEYAKLFIELVRQFNLDVSPMD
jgi:hypothetical protein